MTGSDRDRKLFGRNISLHRRRLGLSKAALARKADISRQTLHEVEEGFRTPRFDSLMRLADALRVDPGELFKGLRS
ncbi:MAG: helix-turn-helix transcriptional regulator [Actinobacteria bacterium]|nr:helix-turn-helix transcriptional regulator [Actinomycetota bacterium]